MLCMDHDEKVEGCDVMWQQGEAGAAMASRRISPLAEANKSAEGQRLAQVEVVF